MLYKLMSVLVKYAETEMERAKRRANMPPRRAPELSPQGTSLFRQGIMPNYTYTLLEPIMVRGWKMRVAVAERGREGEKGI
jgi:hypothetical protein